MRADEKIAFVLFVAFVAGVFVLEARALARELRRRLRGEPSEPRAPALRLVHALAVAGILCILYGLFVEPNRLTVTRISLSTPKVARAVRILHISDTHCDLAPRLEAELVRTANGLDPDLVVMTGDAVNDPGALPLFRRTMSELKAKSGKYACLGNYDAWIFPGLDLFSGTGFVPLDGERTVAAGGGEIRLAGFPIDRFADAARHAAASSPGATFSVLLFHTPDIAPHLAGGTFDLCLTGHTHGGQVALPRIGALVTFTRVGRALASGLHGLPGGTLLHVSRGIGMEGGRAPRVRFLASPQLAVIDLLPAGGGASAR